MEARAMGDLATAAALFVWFLAVGAFEALLELFELGER